MLTLQPVGRCGIAVVRPCMLRCAEPHTPGEFGERYSFWRGPRCEADPHRTRRPGVPRRLTMLILCAAVLLFAVGAAQAKTIHLVTHQFDPRLGEPEVASWLRDADPATGEHGYYLVQLSGPPTDARKVTIEATGATLIAYMPDDAYIVRATTAARDAMIDSDAVNWAGLYHPAYKLSPTIGTHEFVSPGRAGDSFLTLMVRVFDDMGGTADAIEALGANVLESTDDGMQKLLVVHASPQLVNSIAQLREVWWISERPEFTLMNDRGVWCVQSNVTNQMSVWDQGIHGENQIVGVMDSGLDYNSCWFRDGGAAPGPSHRKVIDYTLYGGETYDGCDDGHGTHVCGTIAGDQSYVNPGNYSYNGVAYMAKLMMQDVGADDSWSCTTGQVNIPASLTAAYQAAYNGGARIHSNSWGGSENSYDTYAANVDGFMWTNKDFLVVFAAGNAGPDASTVSFPGTAKNCITVGASRRPPNQNTMAGYSSRGPAHDGRYKPTVTACGGEASDTYVNSANNDPGNPPAQTCSIVGSPFQGTSMATPAVSGCAALTRQYFTEGWYPSGDAEPGDAVTPSAALIKAVVTNSATDMATLDIPNYNEGWGRVLLDDALYFDGDARELIVYDEATGVSQGGSTQFEFEVDSTTVPLEVTLVWTDYPASSGASVAIQNDLNLEVLCSQGSTYKGNVFSGGQSVTGGTADSRNVEEVVLLRTPAAGNYTVTISGPTVPHGPQPFALVVTGSFANWPEDTGVGDDAVPAGKAFSISGIAPNPFNPSTTITYVLNPVETGKAHATLTIYSVDGRLVRTLVDRVQDPGRHAVTWDGRSMDGSVAASGVYFMELEYGGESATRKMTLLK